MFSNRWMDKQSVVQSYYEILFRYEKEWPVHPTVWWNFKALRWVKEAGFKRVYTVWLHFMTLSKTNLWCLDQRSLLPRAGEGVTVEMTQNGGGYTDQHSCSNS